MNIDVSERAFEDAIEVEGATGKPVVTANQATFWACLRELDVDGPIPGAGRLLAERVAA